MSTSPCAAPRTALPAGSASSTVQIDTGEDAFPSATGSTPALQPERLSCADGDFERAAVAGAAQRHGELGGHCSSCLLREFFYRGFEVGEMAGRRDLLHGVA